MLALLRASFVVKLPFSIDYIRTTARVGSGNSSCEDQLRRTSPWPTFLNSEGDLTFLRAHDVCTGWGPPTVSSTSK
jgi:hypothetical protein